MRPIFLSTFWSMLITTVLILPSCTAPKSVAVDCDAILISPIADQTVISGTRCYVPIAAISNTLDNIQFKVTEGFNFVDIAKTQRGRALLTIDPSSTDIGQHDIHIVVSNGEQDACISFSLQITDIAQIDNIIHCDPSQTSKGNGSLEKPYGSLSQLMASGYTPKDKELIILHNGNHGNVVLSGSGYIVTTKSNHKATLTSLLLQDAQDVHIKGLEIRPANDRGDHNQYLVLIDSTCTQINLSNNQVISTDDASQWTQEDWDKKASRGVKSRADQTIIENNLIQNIFHGIKTEGNNNLVQYNHVDRFGGDAIRNTGSSNTYQSNFLTNATVDDYYAEDGNHDDLFQSWTFDKPIDNITLSHNVMISCADTLMPQRAKIVQGLVCFDGFTTHWTVDQNLVVTDHPHGISLYGAENCTISENTVLKNPHDLYQYESDPWIMVNHHKDGRESTNNTIRNNTSSALNIVTKDATVSENTILDSTLTQKLINYDQWDFRIKK